MPFEGGGLRVTPTEVGGLAGQVTQALQTASQLRPDQTLTTAATAVPGGLLDTACHDLAARWGRELRDLEQSLNHVVTSLRTAATGYTETEHSNAAGFGGLIGGAGGVGGAAGPFGPALDSGGGAALGAGPFGGAFDTAAGPLQDTIRRGSGRLW